MYAEELSDTQCVEEGRKPRPAWVSFSAIWGSFGLGLALHVGRMHTLPMIDAFAPFRCSCYDIPTASPPQALSPGDVARAHGPARPDPGPPSAQTP
eukprot:COSAG01_NODE_44770_length_415_cov_9.015823_1_plen_95_part_01